MATAQTCSGPKWGLVKDPLARVPIDIDWEPWLTAESAVIDTSVWASSEAELVLEDESVNGAVARVFISGGLSGKTYRLRNVITTDNDLEDARTIDVVVRNR